MSGTSPNLLTILRSVLARLGEDSLFDPADPAVLRFKQRILRSIAQLELERKSLHAPDVITPQPAVPPRPPPVPHGALPASRDAAQIPADTAPASADAAPSSAGQPRPPNDSVVVLVTHHPYNSGTDDDGHSSAA